MPLDSSYILSLILYIVPGYLVIYFVSFYADLVKEKDVFERTIQYLLFSTLAYGISFTFSILSFYILTFFGYGFSESIALMFKVPIISTSFGIIFSIPAGIFLGKFYFSNGYPHKHFNTQKGNSPSLFSKYFLKDFKDGAWVACHLKDNTILRGKLIEWDKDEEKRDYLLSLGECIQFIDEGRRSRKVHGKRILINTKDCYFIEFHD